MGYKGTREKSEQNLGKRLSNELNKSECDEMIKAAAEVTLQTKKRRWCGHLFMSRLKNQQRLCEQKKVCMCRNWKSRTGTGIMTHMQCNRTARKYTTLCDMMAACSTMVAKAN